MMMEFKVVETPVTKAYQTLGSSTALFGFKKRPFGDPHWYDCRFYISFYDIGCCGIGTLHNVADMVDWPQEQITDFFYWVCEAKLHKWCPKEWLFSLSSFQVDSSRYNSLIRHPNVMELDVFKNKAHGPNHIHLFRYSVEMDFK